MTQMPESDHDQPQLAGESIEEGCFGAALICLSAHYANSPTMGPMTSERVMKLISRTLEKTHTSKATREALSLNLSIWVYLTKVFAVAVPLLNSRALGSPTASALDPEKQDESSGHILKNYASLKEDIQILSKLMHIARNMLVTSNPTVPQDICAAVQFDQVVYQTIVLCVNVASKGPYEGDMLDDASRARLTDINDLFKKLLMTSLQQMHNWTAKNERNKMSFWYDVLSDDDIDETEEKTESSDDDCPEIRHDIMRLEIQHWIERNSQLNEIAAKLLREYSRTHKDKAPWDLHLSPLAWNWLPPGTVKTPGRDFPADDTATSSEWVEDEPDKFVQDQKYARISRQLDVWWEKARDSSLDQSDLASMESVDSARARESKYTHELIQKCAASAAAAAAAADDASGADVDPSSLFTDDGDFWDDDAGDYGDGPMTGLLTEVPNILDPKHIEALYMIVKSCILDTASCQSTSRVGESLQKTRCCMLLALESGKSLLREMLVFVAVWEQEEQSLIFQITFQIVEAVHNSALIPCMWNAMRLPKDIVSPAQTVLLRMISRMFRARHDTLSTAPADSKEFCSALQLVYFVYHHFRTRIIPECVALMNAQSQIRENKLDPSGLAVDHWDMERAKDGLSQFLGFLMTISEISSIRAYLVEWEAAYELIVLLKGLEAAVPRKPLVELASAPPGRAANSGADAPPADQDHADGQVPPPRRPPHIQDPAWKFPWAGMKGLVLPLLASLLQPPDGKTSPGNAEVQAQVVRYNGIIPLLNCCVYDDNNRFARERVQLCLKWLMDGSAAANDFLNQLMTIAPHPDFDDLDSPVSTSGEGFPDRPISSPNSAADGSSSSSAKSPPNIITKTVRIDGIGGEVKVQVRAPSAPRTAAPTTARTMVSTTTTTVTSTAQPQPSSTHAPATPRSRSEELLRDIITLADEAARLAMGHQPMSGEGARELGDEEFEVEFM